MFRQADRGDGHIAPTHSQEVGGKQHAPDPYTRERFDPRTVQPVASI
jgi:hypothetical protein